MATKYKICVVFVGLALIDVGEAMRELGEVKDALDMEVKQNFIDPLQNLHEKDLREIQVLWHCGMVGGDSWKSSLGWEFISPVCFFLFQHHLKKLEGRRLDFDYKKKRQGKVTDDEIKQALEKFDDSKEIAEQSMFHLLESDVSTMHFLSSSAHMTYVNLWTCLRVNPG